MRSYYTSSEEFNSNHPVRFDSSVQAPLVKPKAEILINRFVSEKQFIAFLEHMYFDVQIIFVSESDGQYIVIYRK